MKAGNHIWNDYEERSHGLGSVPVLTVVQYTPAWSVPLSGWVSEGQGSSSRPINNPDLYWGGLVYGVDSQYIRLWAPSSGQANYGIFSFCDGWGYDVRGGDCAYIRASVTITMWMDQSATETYSHTELHDISETSGTHEFSLFPAHSIDVDNDIVTVASLATDGSNNGYQFYGTGAAMVDNAEGCGGLVYAYSNVTSALRVWHPIGVNSKIIHVEGMGGGTYNQMSNQANIAIRLFKVSNSVINYCAGVAADPGVNTNTTLTSLADGCMATYTCHSGYNHISGNLMRVYDYSLNIWNGTVPECQAPPATSTESGSVCFNLTTVVNITAVVRIANEIVANLTVPAKTTSKYLRSLTNA
ncbi:uncharacterized protein LOC128555609 [Mercenaria mercenaria]|uniref:uncharacterized protein LOC128555609 n=1 Tax=Mercenaria mercenaria TaxID=6596 RepID=UPI00234F58F2|nr:uncharacterized protein LOC128555609 [Mercenaria mercenaria]